jgi:hypothetical protein
MSRLDTLHTDYLADKAGAEKKCHNKKVQQWLQANPRIGTLHNKELTFYYFDNDNVQQSIGIFETIK